MRHSLTMLRLTQLAFWGALLFTFVEAVIPTKYAIPLFPWDKAEHFAAFYALTVLAAAALPRRSLIVIACMLSAFGASIELIQTLPIVHRDCDYWDWVADTVAILAALAPMLLVRWRAELVRGAISC